MCSWGFSYDICKDRFASGGPPKWHKRGSAKPGSIPDFQLPYTLGHQILFQNRSGKRRKAQPVLIHCWHRRRKGTLIPQRNEKNCSSHPLILGAGFRNWGHPIQIRSHPGEEAVEAPDGGGKLPFLARRGWLSSCPEPA